jgi:hypothetical protein
VIFAAVRGLFLGLVLGALSAFSGNFSPLLPGLVFAAIVLPMRLGWLRKLGFVPVSMGAWWLSYNGASHALQPPAVDPVLFWARWGAQGACLVAAGCLAFGYFHGWRRFAALPLFALAGGAAAQLFGGQGDIHIYLGFMAWQGAVGALLTAFSLTRQDVDL